MKLDKAIEILRRCASDGIPRGETAFNDAVKLGIEALREAQRWRAGQPLHLPNLLPGETEE